MSEQEERLDYLRKLLLTMEWDRSQKQLNPGIEVKYAALKQEFENLKKELSVAVDVPVEAGQ